MKFYSTNRNAPEVNFKTATLYGQAPDKGLYFPEIIPHLPLKFIEQIEQYSNEAIAYEVIRPFVGDEIDEASLMRIVEKTVNFTMPLAQVTDRISSLELFHGPTLAFKDVGARFMSRCLGYFSKDIDKKIVVLVATSGDTGGAVANGFFNVPNVEVVILYPSGKVSPVQEKQLTTLGNNIHALEVNGSFDDCQAMVKEIFSKASSFENIFLTSANSINVARWLPQQFYYWLAWKQWADKNNPPIISIPSGNFGNICAGLLARASGLPVKHFIAACNANDVVPQFLTTEKYQPTKAVATISNAMDVGDPSNFVRIMEIYDHDVNKLRKDLSAVSVSDEITRATIEKVFAESNYTLDPHGAVGFYALEQWLTKHPNDKGIFLETAHPVKFPEVVEEVTGKPIEIPEHLGEMMCKEKMAQKVAADYEYLSSYLKNF